MDQQQTSKLLAVIKTAYPEFLINEQVILLWHSMIENFDYELVRNNVTNHILNSTYAPKISDVVKENQEVSIYQQHQNESQQDQFLLQQYHEEEKAVPMPDHIRTRLQRLTAKLVKENES